MEKAVKKKAKKIIPEALPKKERTPEGLLKKRATEYNGILKTLQPFAQTLEADLKKLEAMKTDKARIEIKIEGLMEDNEWTADDVNKIIGHEFMKMKE